MVLKERYFSRFEVRWYLEIAGEAIFLFELEKIGDETTQKKTQPPPEIGFSGYQWILRS
jgi:hypothetical protein